MPYHKEINKVLIIGSGPIVIGQAAEFDYSGTQGCLALKEEGIKVVLLNNNPATIMTDETIADKVYFEPMTLETLEKIIQKERPDGIIGSLGGQTGLNLTMELVKKKLLEKHQVKLLGTPAEGIQNGEDREKFRHLMKKIGEPVPESKIVTDIADGMDFAREIGYPVVVRPAFTLGGEGGGFAENGGELDALLQKGLSLSPIHQVLVERSIKGWKEIEYEVVRDANDTCIVVCNMENFDPVGIHTGDSIVVAPAQTLTDEQHQILRNASLKIARKLGIIGGCNVQIALDPNSNDYYIIEVNPRVSRSSALASKATGYPIARIATKCALGYHLDEIKNPVTGNTFASFEPALDYVVVKLPRFPFDKFSNADRKLGTQMKATGETMAIDRSFEGSLNKALRSLEIKASGLRLSEFNEVPLEELESHMKEGTDLRIFAIAEGLRKGIQVEQIFKWTQIDLWFLNKLQALVDFEKEVSSYTLESLPIELIKKAKLLNMSDLYLSSLLGCTEKGLRNKREVLGLTPAYKLVDTCAAEFDAETPYYYSTWHGLDESVITGKPKALIVGSGPIRIGQGIEFDYSSVHAVLALKKAGYETIVINNNPETVSTDFSMADKLYFEPITTEDILHIIEKEKPDGVFLQFGGQTAINLAEDLQTEGVHLFGSSVKSIDLFENREQFYQLLEKLSIPHIKGAMAQNANELKSVAENLGFPVLVRPSYVIGGQSMKVFYGLTELDDYIKELLFAGERIWPLLIDKYLPGLECELDCISDGVNVYIPGIFEHVEKAGVHSGDSIAVYPPQTLSMEQKDILVEYTEKICTGAEIIGVANIQFVISDETVYCLEVNPRASRTVPILSKVTGIPIVEMAIAAQLVQPLVLTGLAPETGFVAVKMPIFSFNKLKGVDPLMSPEMKSTGEVLGLGSSFNEALLKAAGGQPINRDKGQNVFCSLADHAKQSGLSAIQALPENVVIYATEGTAEFLNQHQVPVIKVKKSLHHLEALFKNKTFAATLIIPNKGTKAGTLGNEMRESAIRYRVPFYSNLETFQSIWELSEVHTSTIHSIDEYLYPEVKEG